MDQVKRKNEGRMTRGQAKKIKLEKKSKEQDARLQKMWNPRREGKIGSADIRVDQRLGKIKVESPGDFMVKVERDAEEYEQDQGLPSTSTGIQLKNESSSLDQPDDIKVVLVNLEVDIPNDVVVKDELDIPIDENLDNASGNLDVEENNGYQQTSQCVVPNEFLSVNQDSVNLLIDDDVQKKSCCDECAAARLIQAGQIQQLQDAIHQKDIAILDLNNRVAMLENFNKRHELKQTNDVSVRCDLVTHLLDQGKEIEQSSVSVTDCDKLDKYAEGEYEQQTLHQSDCEEADPKEPNSDSTGDAEAVYSSQEEITEDSDVIEQETLKPLLPYLSEKDVLGSRSLLFTQIKKRNDKRQNDKNLLNLNKNARLLLEKYGMQILNLKICRYHREKDLTFCERLVLWLNLVPNLRSLHVINDVKMNSDFELNKEVETLSDQLPMLLMLESLTLEGYISGRCHNNGNLGLVSSFYLNNQLKCLGVPGEFWTPWAKEKWPEGSLKGLSKLKISSASEDQLHIVSTRCGSLLEELVVGTRQGVPHLNQDSSLQTLNGLQIRVLDTTPRVKLPPCGYFWRTWTVPVDLNSWSLPKLHTLRMRYEMERTGFQFLGRMSALQNLEVLVFLSTKRDSLCEKWMLENTDYFYRDIEGDPTVDEVSKEVLRWVYQVPTRNKTLVWELMPSLQIIKIPFMVDAFELKAYTFRKEEHV